MIATAAARRFADSDDILFARGLVGRWRCLGCFRSEFLVRIAPRAANGTAQKLGLIGSQAEALAAAGSGGFGPRRGRAFLRDWHSRAFHRHSGRRDVTGNFRGVTRLAWLAVLLGLLLARCSKFARLAKLTWLPLLSRLSVLARLARLAGFARLLGIAELAIAVAIETTLSGLTLGPLAAIVAILAILPLVAGMSVTEAGRLILPVLPVLLLRPTLVERRLHVALAGMAGEHRLLRSGVVTLPHIIAGAVVGALLVTATAVHRLAGLLNLLLTIREDNAVVVLGMLQVVLGEHVIAGSLSVSGELEVLLCDMSRGTAHLYVRAVRLEASGEGVLPLAVAGVIVVVVVVDVVAATATAMLLSLPHGLPISQLGFSIIRARPRAAGHA